MGTRSKAAIFERTRGSKCQMSNDKWKMDSKSLRVDNLRVHIYDSRLQMGKTAAAAVADEVRRLIRAHGHAVGIFASAPSQNEFLAALVEAPDIDWTCVIGFHLDEYLGMESHAPQSFRRFLTDRFVSKVPLGKFYGLQGEATDPERACTHYAELLGLRVPDFAVLGIGENGHLAFIDPPFCDFHDPAPVKVVELDEVCRRQQVNDGAFHSLEEVPLRALSLTVPTIMACPRLFAIAPGRAKQQAIRSALEGEIATTCPASALRLHKDAQLFIDREAAALLSRWE
jgi:glucosamine-6-phosphate deaminase